MARGRKRQFAPAQQLCLIFPLAKPAWAKWRTVHPIILLPRFPTPFEHLEKQQLSIKQETQVIELMETIASLPEDQWPAAATERLKSKAAIGIPNIGAKEAIRIALGDMRIQQMRLGRSVQPIGVLHVLAPIIGAIRRNDPGADFATSFLGNQILAAIVSTDGETFRRIAEFLEAPLGTHRNCLIWDAIFELINKNSVSEIINAEGHEVLCKTFTIPDTKAVKVYVVQQQIQNRFTNLPAENGRWAQLWKESGAGRLIHKSTRGKARS